MSCGPGSGGVTSGCSRTKEEGRVGGGSVSEREERIVWQKEGKGGSEK